jgi:hypothetical protein
MTPKQTRALAALILAVSSSALGYSAGTSKVSSPNIPSVTVTAPPAGSVRVLYSLDQKQNDKEIIALIEGAKTHIYFAVYTFTLTDIAEALVAAKKRGVDVRGITDSGQSAEKFSEPVMKILAEGGVPMVVEKHAGSNGIMHIKMIVTDKAYALGSYNWTASATNINDEVLEIGTDETLRKTYEDFLLKLLDAYKGNAAASAAAPIFIGTIDYTEASKHISETASVQGKLLKAYTAKSGVTFLDFCTDYKSCPFTAVIFSDDFKKFPDLQSYVGQTVTLTGKISSYQGTAEIVLSSASQVSKE